MFKKILVANRGEVADRVIFTCKKMGIQTVAIYSEADKGLPYVYNADESYLIGGNRVSESYLNIDKIIEVAKETNAEAIHPGYGLLSENNQFALRCEEEGIKFIGPSSEMIKIMGDKIEARMLMEEIGVPLVPGTTVPLVNANEAINTTKTLGYPVMLKASAGGGGIGMQIVQNEDDFISYFESNQKRAEAYFGNGAMYLEKYIENPRHIEMQVLADDQGNAVCLWERECSIQRRNQKVIEEAPSTFLDEETRKAMGEVAIKIVKKLNYKNAGTIEFLVDENKNFYFLEMNTRLQVEHAVTEEITGIDIVEEQIKIAYGSNLSLGQQEIVRNGHAIEARIYAEDPKTFYPSPGVIHKLQTPVGENIRLDLAVKEGSEVTPFYDPMIAKITVKGESRDIAITKMISALNKFHIEGLKTNIPLLLQVLNHEKFHEGDITTNFIKDYIINKHLV